jgi:hypothetical protein
VRLWRALRIVALVLGALTLVLAALAISREPSVPVRGRPTAAEIRAGEDVLRQLDAIQAAGAGTISLDSAGSSGLAAIASRATGQERLRLDLHPDRVVAAGSHDLPLGLWLNFAVTALADGTGPPQLRISVGRLTLPSWATPLALGAARRILRFRGTDVPPLDEIVRTLAIGRDGLSARLRLPPGADVAGAMAQLRPSNVEADEVLRHWCRLARRQLSDPEPSLAGQVRRTFEGIAATPAAHRAAFVALAMLAVDPRVGELAGLTRARAAECAGPAASIRLAGREDLAKHWALSGALAAALGFEAAQAAGIYKELADSGSGGSGFSFVDLAADRSGLRAARLALAPRTAANAARRLAAATEEDLLPADLRSLPEGLSDAQFAARFGTPADPRYRAMVRTIDGSIERRWRDRR